MYIDIDAIMRALAWLIFAFLLLFCVEMLWGAICCVISLPFRVLKVWYLGRKPGEPGALDMLGGAVYLGLLSAFIISLSLIMLLILTGCGGGGSPTPQQPLIAIPPPPPPPPPPITFTLTVLDLGIGSGNVLSSLEGINCTTNPTMTACSTTFPSGTVVSLTATPTTGSVFAGWSGDCTGTGTCSVRMDANKFVNATFNLAPLQLGISGSNALDISTLQTAGGPAPVCCSGTLGSLVSRKGHQYILSNAHVLARDGSGSLGEDIVTPGLADSHCVPGRKVAVLSQFVLGQAFPQIVSADAALAEVVPDAIDPSGSISIISHPPSNGTATVTIGMDVAKVGRSGLSCAQVLQTGVDVTVQYLTHCATGDKFFVHYPNQILVSGGPYFADGGDSGSLVMDATNSRAIGIAVAGTPDVVVVQPIGDVLQALQDSSGKVPAIVGGADSPITCPKGPSSVFRPSQRSKPPQGIYHARALTQFSRPAN